MSPATPQEQILGIVNSHWQSCCVGAAAQLELADLLADGPLHVDILARYETHAPNLYRMLRALESTGIFTQTSPRVLAIRPRANVSAVTWQDRTGRRFDLRSVPAPRYSRDGEG